MNYSCFSTKGVEPFIIKFLRDLGLIWYKDVFLLVQETPLWRWHHLVTIPSPKIRFPMLIRQHCYIDAGPCMKLLLLWLKVSDVQFAYLPFHKSDTHTHTYILQELTTIRSALEWFVLPLPAQHEWAGHRAAACGRAGRPTSAVPGVAAQTTTAQTVWVVNFYSTTKTK